jgi:hypothetical protein
MKNSLCVRSAALPGLLTGLMCCDAAFAQKVATPVDTAAAAAALADTNAVPRYFTSAEVAKMPACMATFTSRLPRIGGEFTTTEGRRFIIGGIPRIGGLPMGDSRVSLFVRALREGRTYKLPETFTNYLSATHYVTREEIAAMPPCTATIASRTPCSSYFLTTDGKWFGIGDPGSGPLISHFIWAAKEGKNYQFPDAFQKFAAAISYTTAAEITAMTPRRATLVNVLTDGAYFEAEDGKIFFIGGKKSGAEVRRFLDTLEDAKTYELPAAFVSFQKPNK